MVVSSPGSTKKRAAAIGRRSDTVSQARRPRSPSPSFLACMTQLIRILMIVVAASTHLLTHTLLPSVAYLIHGHLAIVRLVVAFDFLLTRCHDMFTDAVDCSSLLPCELDRSNLQFA